MTKIIAITNTNIQAQRNAANFSMPQNNDIQLPTKDRNYCIFNQNLVDFFVSQKEKSLPYLKEILQTSQDEKEIVEALYIVDRLADSDTKGIPAMYPVLSKFNNTNSPNIQTFLAGIYRKTQVPDAFGPLVSMLIKNSINQTSEITKNKNIDQNPPFDPNEEIGGAILAYMQNYSSGNPKKIDYSA